MKLRKYGHSCILLEEKGEKLLFDPGNYVFMSDRVAPKDFAGISLIVITHEHADHVDIPSLKEILKDNPQAAVIGNQGVAAALKKEGIDVTVLEDGEENFGDFLIRAVPARHEELLRPVPQNTAFLINKTVLHVGDSLDPKLTEFKGVPVLALPVTAPWATQKAIADFAVSLSPRVIVPIHDGYAIDYFVKRQYGNYNDYFSNHGFSLKPLMSPEEILEV